MLSLKEYVKTLESQVQNETRDLRLHEITSNIYRPGDSGFKKTVIKRFEIIEEIIGADKQGKKAQGQVAISPVAVRTGLLMVLESYPVSYSDKVSEDELLKAQREPKKVDGHQWGQMISKKLNKLL